MSDFFVLFIWFCVATIGVCVFGAPALVGALFILYFGGKEMKKTGQLIFNIFWVILIGIPTTISSALAGASLCLTIIGIPLGLQYFKYIKLIFAPAGKRVARKFSRHPVLNTLWLIFGGLEVSVVYFTIGILFAITIIGVPLGRQLIKISLFLFAPFGAEIVNENEYSTNKDTGHDRQLLYRRMAADKKLKEKLTVGRERAQELYDHKLNPRRLYPTGPKATKRIIFIVAPLTIVAAVLGGFVPFEIFASVLIALLVAFLVFTIVWMTIWVNYWQKIEKKLDLVALTDEYPKGKPTIQGVISFEELYALAGIIENVDPSMLEMIKSKATKLEE